MPAPSTNAREALRINLKDVERLLTFYANVRIVSQKAETLAVLNKSAIVLITAAWEAYCEDVAEEAIRHVAQHGRSWKDVPLALQKRVARELKDERHELAVWRLSGEGWRSVLSGRIESQRRRGRWGVQSPMAERIVQFFADEAGLSGLEAAWEWPDLDYEAASRQLNAFVALRHLVAHGASSPTVSKIAVKRYRRLVVRLADQTDAHFEALAVNATGTSLWAPGPA